MVNVEDIYGESAYLKASDLPPRPVKYVIDDIYPATFNQNGGVVTKLVMVLKGEKKKFIVNKTNAGILSGMFGKETDNWKGKEVVIAKQLIKTSDGQEVFTIMVQRPK